MTLLSTVLQPFLPVCKEPEKKNRRKTGFGIRNANKKDKTTKDRRYGCTDKGPGFRDMHWGNGDWKTQQDQRCKGRSGGT
jgi:hypothetical protein